jgi:hypothetical protein
MVRTSSLKRKPQGEKACGSVTVTINDGSWGCPTNNPQTHHLHPFSPQAVTMFPGDSLLGYSTHSDSSSASFDVRDGIKAAVGKPPLRHCGSFAESASSFVMERCVTFPEDAIAETRLIEHRNDMTDDEKEARWYDRTDLKRVRKEGRITARLVRDGYLLRDTDDHCLLGLDGESDPCYARLREMHRATVRDLVFSEQDRQRELGLHDPEGLSEMTAALRARCRHARFVSSLRDDRTERRGIIN